MRTDLDRRTNGAKRRREGIRKATDVLVEMVAEAIASGSQASHLLFDSWFAYPATMRKLLAKGVHTLCMLKVTEKIFYRYQGEVLLRSDSIAFSRASKIYLGPMKYTIGFWPQARHIVETPCL